MVTIVWHPTGSQVIDVLLNGCKFNSSHSQNEILGSLSEWRNEQAGAVSRRLIAHADNGRPHHGDTAAASRKFMEENGMTRASVQRDLTRRTWHRLVFGLLCCVRHCPRGQSFEAAGELFSSIEAVLTGREEFGAAATHTEAYRTS
jgi:hypothetical protein